MKFNLFSRDGTPLEFQQQCPDGLNQYRLKDSFFLAGKEDFGTFIFQQIPCGEFSISYSVFNMETPCSLVLAFDQPCLSLNHIFENDLHLNGLGMNNLVIEKDHFNLRFLPSVNCELNLKKGLTIEFAIQYTPQYLQKYANHYPQVQSFLRKAEWGMPCYLASSYIPVGLEVTEIIKELLANDYDGKLRKLFLDFKSLEILNIAAKTLGVFADAPSSKSELELMERVKRWLDEHHDQPGSLADIARIAGTNEFTLKKLFKQYFHTTVFDYIQRLKMEKAAQLLKKDDINITTAAYKTGYGSVFSFSKAFKKYYGVSPTEVRPNKCA